LVGIVMAGEKASRAQWHEVRPKSLDGVRSEGKRSRPYSDGCTSTKKSAEWGRNGEYKNRSKRREAGGEGHRTLQMGESKNEGKAEKNLRPKLYTEKDAEEHPRFQKSRRGDVAQEGMEDTMTVGIIPERPTCRARALSEGWGT